MDQSGPFWPEEVHLVHLGPPTVPHGTTRWQPNANTPLSVTPFYSSPCSKSRSRAQIAEFPPNRCLAGSDCTSKQVNTLSFSRSAPKGRQQMGETGFCKNLRFSAVFCANLRLPNPLIYRASRKSAKICENVRSGSGFSLLLSPF